MFSGHNFIGYTSSAKSDNNVKVFSTLQGDFLPETFTPATEAETAEAVAKAKTAFETYKNTAPGARSIFLATIAEEIINLGDGLIQRAMYETGLPEARLVGERARTVNQLNLFADLLREGSWVEAVIDPALPARKPVPRPDLRKMLVPVGPVVVFGASNFPFAFSTAGGDTASALAAGCPVIVKAHSAHLGTNELVAKAVMTAALKCNMPDGVFSSLIGEGAQLGQALAKHPFVKAIGFTGSYRAGMALYKTAVTERETPIPVYAEMSSINPVLLLPDMLREHSDTLAAQLAGSITLGVGQFCTNPGILFVINSEASAGFITLLARKLEAVPEAVMLNAAVCKAYYTERKRMAGETGVESLIFGEEAGHAYKGSPALLKVSAQTFLHNPVLQNEMFGPASLVVDCKDQAELLKAVDSLQGQLTGSVFGTAGDIRTYAGCIDVLTGKVGRLIYNGVPTGVEVCHAMVHGGPFPATTNGRTTSVGADAIKRFVRPVCFQDCPEAFLPEALQDQNPLGLMRRIDGRYTKAPVQQWEEA